MTTTLAVSGMTCNGCVRHVDKALRDVPGVTAVTVDLPGARAIVEHEPHTPIPSLLDAVSAAGYSAIGSESHAL